MNDNIKYYVRIVTTYYRLSEYINRYGISTVRREKWDIRTIKEDFGNRGADDIKKYAGFTLVPDNRNYKKIIDDRWNLYAPFAHESNKGDFKHTEGFLRHIFGEQYSIGIKYLQCLYLHPKQALPVLALVSKERQTGKSTFLDWITAIFGDNTVVVDAKNIKSEFNGVYAKANIIGIEETFIDKSDTIEKIKSISTQKTMTVNEKQIQHYSIPFFGKIIMNSNNEDKFIKIDEQEIRFFVRKISVPEKGNHNILNDMIEEIPAFLYHLETLPPIDFSKSRMVFTAEELRNETLANVKEESKSWLHKELKESFQDYFDNSQSNSNYLHVTPTDIKDKWFHNNSQVQRNYIKTVLKNEFGFSQISKVERYSPFQESSKTGRPYIVPKSLFVKESEEIKSEELPF